MRETIRAFTERPIYEAASGLLERLGVQHTPDFKDVPFDDYFEMNDFSYAYINEVRACVEHIWNLGYIDKSSFQQTGDGAVQRYEFMDIFACEIKPEARFNRQDAVALTRAFNRCSSRNFNKDIDIPVIVLMKKGNLLSIATCERPERKDGMGDRMGKVTILRNINCEELHAGHRQILE